VQREAVLSPPLPHNILLVERLWTSMILPMLNLQALGFQFRGEVGRIPSFLLRLNADMFHPMTFFRNHLDMARLLQDI